MGLRELLSVGPFGPSAEEVLAEGSSPAALEALQQDKAWADVGRQISETYQLKDKVRRDSALNRRRLYDGRGLDLALGAIEDAFKDERVRALYKSFAPYAKVNYLKRKTRERSRLYAKAPIVRKVDGDTDNKNYQWLQRATRHNQAMKFADETTDYQNDTFWLFRTRDTPRGREPRTDIVGPEAFVAIVDPGDQTKLFAIGVDKSPSGPVSGSNDAALIRWRSSPHWVIWSDDESFELDGKWNIIRESIQPNPYRMIPGVLVNNGYRDRMLLDPHTGSEAVATHLSLWLQESMKLKGIAAKTRQAVFTGETGSSPKGQSQDDTTDMQVAEGVGVTTIERGIDINQFIASMDHTEERAAASEGIPPQVLRHAGATSGYEMDLRRIPLEEIREDRVDIFRDAERDFAEVQSAVIAIDMPSKAFKTDGWHIDFAEIKRPQQEGEKWNVRQIKRKMGHSDPVVEAQEDNPDFDDEMAKDWVEQRMKRQAEFEEARATRNLAADPMVDSKTPEQNGAMGVPEKPDDEEDEDESKEPKRNAI